MQAPTITLDGKGYTARRLKMKSWRNIVKLQKDISNMDTAEIMNDEATMQKMAEVIATIVNDPEVTADRVMDELDLADFVPTVQEMTRWVTEQVSGKIEQLPKNSQTTV